VFSASNGPTFALIHISLEVQLNVRKCKYNVREEVWYYRLWTATDTP